MRQHSQHTCAHKRTALLTDTTGCIAAPSLSVSHIVHTGKAALAKLKRRQHYVHVYFMPTHTGMALHMLLAVQQAWLQQCWQAASAVALPAQRRQPTNQTLSNTPLSLSGTSRHHGSWCCCCRLVSRAATNKQMRNTPLTLTGTGSNWHATRELVVLLQTRQQGCPARDHKPRLRRLLASSGRRCNRCCNHCCNRCCRCVSGASRNPSLSTLAERSTACCSGLSKTH